MTCRCVMLLGLLFGPVAGLLAQDRSAAVPIGSRVHVEPPGAKAVTGTVVAWRADTVVLAAEEPEEVRGDTVPVPLTGVRGFKVVESPSLWRHATQTDIEFYTVTSVPQHSSGDSLAAESDRSIILVADGERLKALDPATGSVLWSRDDFPKLKRMALDIMGTMGYGVITRGDTMLVLDLGSGETRWHTGALSLARARGWLPVDTSQMLVYGVGADSLPTLLAVEPAGGVVRWRQTGLFTVEPEVFKREGVSFLLGHQTPLVTDDTTLVLYVSADGPMALDARTGTVRWRAASLTGTKVPKLRDGYARMLVRRGILFVPAGKQLLALNAADGTNAWSTARTLRGQVDGMWSTPHGLLTLADGRLDLLGFADGASVWREPFKLKRGSRFYVRGDTVFATADEDFVVLSVSDGSARAMGSVKFKEGEKPSAFVVLQDGFVLYSWHNVARLNPDGTQPYQVVYRSPGLSFGERLGAAALDRDVYRPTTRSSGSRVYFFTGDADVQGREGNSVVEFNAAAGREDGRVWLDARSPLYLLDPASGSVYALRDDREVVAYKFVARTALTHAAGSGWATVVGRLLDMGADVNAANDRGWTPLHAAAAAGRPDVVSLLLSRGADVGAVRVPGWMPLHYAARNGHLEAVRRLVAAGADPEAAAALGDETWLPWMLAARNGHAEIVTVLRDGGSEYNEAVDQLLTAWHHATHDEVDEAIVAHQAALTVDSTLAVFPRASRVVCYRAALDGRAADVLDACDRAVTHAAEADRNAAWFARGIARALAGDPAGAIGDLESIAEPAESETADARYDPVPAWIAALRAGENPFTPEVVAWLKQSGDQ